MTMLKSWRTRRIEQPRVKVFVRDAWRCAGQLDGSRAREDNRYTKEEVDALAMLFDT